MGGNVDDVGGNRQSLWQTHNEGVPFCIEETITDGERGVGVPLCRLCGVGGCVVLVSDLAERIIVCC